MLFTDAPMEVTENKNAEMLTRNQTVESLIESNNGGRGYARNVKRILRVDMKNFRCAIRTFTQTENKKTRIYTNSACVMNDILFPEGWEKKWPKFYNALMSYRKDNKKRNQHDDAPDALTGVYEMHAKKGGKKKSELVINMEKMISPNGVKVNMCCASCLYNNYIRFLQAGILKDGVLRKIKL